MEKKSLLGSALKLTLAGMLLVGCSGGSSTTTTTTDSGSTSTPEATSEVTIGQSEGQELAEDAEVYEGQVDRIVVAVNAPSTDASPFAMNTATRNQVHEALYANLFYIEPAHFIEDVQPYIGKSITQVDDYTYDIEIFDNVTDSKGNKITAYDVLWSYEYSFTNQEFLVYGTDVESFEVIDDTHLRMVVTKTVPGVIENLMRSGALTIVNQEWFENATDEERQMDPAATGPYTLVTHVSGSEIIVEANDNYWKTDESQMNPIELRQVKEIDFKVITEDSMRAIALENKEVDFAQVSATNIHRFYDSEAGEPLEGYNVWMGSTSFMYNLFLCNMDPNGPSPLAQDINLRRAALYAISSEDIMLAAGQTYDTGVVLRSFAVPGQGGYQDHWNDDDWDYFNYDPEKAREFYEASGHAPGEVEVTVLTNIAIYPDSVRSVIIANLEEAGFKVNLLAVDGALTLKYRFESDQWDLFLVPKLAGDYVVTGWDVNFNPVGFTNGSIAFTHDDKLTELLEAANTNTNDETINAFNDYMIDQAILKAVYSANAIYVAQDGILKMQLGTGGFAPSGSVYSKDYVSAPNTTN